MADFSDPLAALSSLSCPCCYRKVRLYTFIFVSLHFIDFF
jgi:hypothetical protein